MTLMRSVLNLVDEKPANEQVMQRRSVALQYALTFVETCLFSWDPELKDIAVGVLYELPIRQLVERMLSPSEATIEDNKAALELMSKVYALESDAWQLEKMRQIFPEAAKRILTGFIGQVVGKLSNEEEKESKLETDSFKPMNTLSDSLMVLGHIKRSDSIQLEGPQMKGLKALETLTLNLISEASLALANIYAEIAPSNDDAICSVKLLVKTHDIVSEHFQTSKA